MAWDPILRTVPQYVDSNGNPYSGAVLKFYAAGTSTNISAATDSTGATTVSSIALNAAGFPEVSGNVVIPHLDQPFKIALYPTQAAADADSGAIWTPDNISIGSPTNEWQASGVTPVFASTTTFTLSDDQTADFHVGRRLRLTDSGGIDYATITASVYSSPNTTVTVEIDDSGVLDSGLSTVELGILSGENSSVPFFSFSGGNATASGDFTVSKTFTETKGADVASAATLTLGDGNVFDITGTTAITSIASKGVGTEVVLQFDAATTLTHHATDLILPAGENISTAAGDVAVLREYASGDWILVSYLEASSPVSRRSQIISNVDMTNGGANDQTSVVTNGLPSWVRWVSISIEGYSQDANDDVAIQIGPSGGLVTTGYVSGRSSDAATRTTDTTQVILNNGTSTVGYTTKADMILVDATNNTWFIFGQTFAETNGAMYFFGGRVSLAGALEQVAVKSAAGTNNFDAGAYNLTYGG